MMDRCLPTEVDTHLGKIIFVADFLLDFLNLNEILLIVGNRLFTTTDVFLFIRGRGTFFIDIKIRDSTWMVQV